MSGKQKRSGEVKTNVLQKVGEACYLVLIASKDYGGITKDTLTAALFRKRLLAEVDRKAAQQKLLFVC